MPIAAALYGRPERDRPRWLFDIVVLDLVLIALFAAFLYIYFIVTIVVTDGREDLYNANIRQLLNAKNLLLVVWATWVWRTAPSPAVAAHARHLCRGAGVDVLRRHRPRRGRHRRIAPPAPVGPRLHGAVRRDAAGRGNGLRPQAVRTGRGGAGAVAVAGGVADRDHVADCDSDHRRGRAAVARRCRRRPSRCGPGWRSR